MDLSGLSDVETRMPIMLGDEDAKCLIKLLEDKSCKSDIENDLLNDLKYFWYKHFSGTSIILP